MVFRKPQDVETSARRKVCTVRSVVGILFDDELALGSDQTT